MTPPPNEQPWDEDRPNESPTERIDRNYSELLQELRVAQAGVQILFAFLLSIAFQQRFTTLSPAQRGVYLGTLVSAALAAVLLIAPVPIHRIVFRHHRKSELVAVTNRLALIGLGFLLLAVLGGIALIIDVVAGAVAAAVIGGCVAAVCVTVWYAVPMRWRMTHRPQQRDDARDESE